MARSSRSSRWQGGRCPLTRATCTAREGENLASAPRGAILSAPISSSSRSAVGHPASISRSDRDRGVGVSTVVNLGVSAHLSRRRRHRLARLEADAPPAHRCVTSLACWSPWSWSTYRLRARPDTALVVRPSSSGRAADRQRSSACWSTRRCRDSWLAGRGDRDLWARRCWATTSSARGGLGAAAHRPARSVSRGGRPQRGAPRPRAPGRDRRRVKGRTCSSTWSRTRVAAARVNRALAALARLTAADAATASSTKKYPRIAQQHEDAEITQMATVVIQAIRRGAPLSAQQVAEPALTRRGAGLPRPSCRSTSAARWFWIAKGTSPQLAREDDRASDAPALASCSSTRTAQRGLQAGFSARGRERPGQRLLLRDDAWTLAV